MSAIPGCQCGCGEPTIRATYTARQSGIIKGQFREYLPYHKPRPLTSLIWTVSREELEQIVQESESVIDIMRRLGYTNTPGSRYPSLYARLEQEGIEVPVYKRKESLHLIKEARPLEEVLIENSTYSRYALKKRLIKEKILEEKCSECNLPPEWNGKQLSLTLDHKNGVNNDNRIENLRLLCPNCHSQTETFAGKRRAKSAVESRCKCGNKIAKREACVYLVLGKSVGK